MRIQRINRVVQQGYSKAQCWKRTPQSWSSTVCPVGDRVEAMTDICSPFPIKDLGEADFSPHWLHLAPRTETRMLIFNRDYVRTTSLLCHRANNSFGVSKTSIVLADEGFPPSSQGEQPTDHCGGRRNAPPSTARGHGCSDVGGNCGETRSSRTRYGPWKTLATTSGRSLERLASKRRCSTLARTHDLGVTSVTSVTSGQVTGVTEVTGGSKMTLRPASTSII